MKTAKVIEDKALFASLLRSKSCGGIRKMSIGVDEMIAIKTEHYELTARIAELAAERDKYKSALERIRCGGTNYELRNIARNALREGE